MGINQNGTPYPERNPLEGTTPAPDREDEHYETWLFTTTDEREAKDAALKLEQLSRDIRQLLESELLPLEQRREDERLLAAAEARRREKDFARRMSLADKRIATYEFLSVPSSEAVKKYDRWAVFAIAGVEFPLAFVAGYSLVGGINTGDANIDAPLRLAPFGFALGIAVICCLATICAGRMLGAYAEQQRVNQTAALARENETSIDNDTNIDETQEHAA